MGIANRINQMKKPVLTCVLILLTSSFFITEGLCQTAGAVPMRTFKVGIFAPLFLDSIFNEGGNYKYGKNFPKFVMPGLDFVLGARIALDSMMVERGNISATFFDSKSDLSPLPKLISNKNLDGLDLIIGSVKDQEFLQLAKFAQEKNIPFISASYPNDGGITQNPFLVIVNSTLQAHCEAIYAYLLQSHGTQNIFLVRRPGSQEDKVSGYFKRLNSPDGKPLVNIRTVNVVNDDFTPLLAGMDSTKENIIIGASLNQDFATKLAANCAKVYKQKTSLLIGMPNWDGFPFVVKKSATIKDFPVYYTTPFYNGRWKKESKLIETTYREAYKTGPSDMTFKGFEAVYLFLNLLTRFPNDYMNHLNEGNFKLFSDYLFKPVFSDKNVTVPDYFENKKLYFMRSINGSVTKAW